MSEETVKNARLDVEDALRALEPLVGDEQTSRPAAAISARTVAIVEYSLRSALARLVAAETALVGIISTHSTEALVAELDRRARALHEHKCDRCGRPLWSAPSCESPERHSPCRAAVDRPTLRLVVTGPAGSGKTTVAAEHVRLAARSGYDLEVEERQLEMKEET